MSKEFKLSRFLIVVFLAGFFAIAGATNETKLKPKKHKIKTIVIDPGHGGHDSGCQGSSSYEKNIALSVSLKLGKLIEMNFPDVKVIYTRKKDVFIELHQRAKIANENKADLFICIHCNSGPKSAYGSETYVMGLHKTDDNLGVAKRENAVILKEENYENKYDGFDPNSPEANIIFSLYQNAFLTQSLYFAEKLQHEFKHHAGRYNRGVKQAGFLVLYKTTMPSVLIETGFLTNHAEEKYLFSKKGQNKMAASMLRAFSYYKGWLEEKDYSKNLSLPQEYQEENNDEESDDIKGPKEESHQITESSTQDSAPVLKDTILKESIIYRVQIKSSPEKINLNSPVFNGKNEVFEYFSNNSYKYTVGNYEKLDDAIKLQAEMKKEGFSDAFVVAFKNNQRISLEKALSDQ